MGDCDLASFRRPKAARNEQEVFPAVLAPTLERSAPMCHRADPREAIASDWSWWLFCTRAQHEKALATRLLAFDVPHVLPLRREVRVKGSRNRVVRDLPVFPSYVFACGDEFDRGNSMAAISGKPVHIISVSPTDAIGLVRDLSQLLDALETGGPIGKARPAPQPGDRYRVADGPWEGMVGTLERTTHGGRALLLHIHSLGQVVPLEIEAARVELIEDQ